MAKLKPPRAAWLMVPAAAVDETLHGLSAQMQKGDIIVDGGNSYYIDDIRRAKELKPRGIHYLDVGTSGGVWGFERGFCLMIGGEAEPVRHLDPVFKTLAPGRGDISRTPGREKSPGTAEEGYLYCGPSGAGHFVKMVHNGIEYGLMEAYAEGLNILRHANVGKAGPHGRCRDDAAAQSGTLSIRLQSGGRRRSLASWQCDRFMAAGSDRKSHYSGSRISPSFPAACPIPGKAGGLLMRPSTSRFRLQSWRRAVRTLQLPRR